MTVDKDLFWEPPPRPNKEKREPTLKIVPESLEVHHIRGITFAMDDYPVKRHRSKKLNIKFIRHTRGRSKSSTDL